MATLAPVQVDFGRASLGAATISLIGPDRVTVLDGPNALVADAGGATFYRGAVTMPGAFVTGFYKAVPGDGGENLYSVATLADVGKGIALDTAPILVYFAGRVGLTQATIALWSTDLTVMLSPTSLPANPLVAMEVGSGYYAGTVDYPGTFATGTYVADPGDGTTATIYFTASLADWGLRGPGGETVPLISHWGAKALPFTNFGGGLVRDTDAAQIQPNQSPDLKNVDQSNDSVSKRRGKAKYNSAVPTGTSGHAVNAVTAYYANDDSRYVAMQAADRIYVDSDNNGSFDYQLISGLTGGVFGDFVQYRNTLYFGNSVDNLVAWKGSFAGFGDTYRPQIFPTPGTALTLSLTTFPVDDFQTGTWTTRNAANSGGGTMTAAKVTTLFKEGTGSLQLTLPNTAMNEFVYNDLAAPLDLSKADALGIWVYQSVGTGGAFQVTVHNGTGNSFDWTVVPAFTVTANQAWQFVRIPLNAIPPTSRTTVQGIAIRFLGWGVDNTGLAQTTLSYLYFDAAYALGPFPPDTYRYYYTKQIGWPNLDLTDGKTESAPSPVAEIVVPDNVPVYSINVTKADDATHAVYNLYRYRLHGVLQTAKLLATQVGWQVLAPYVDLTSDATLILGNPSDLVFGRSGPPKAATWALVRDRLWAGNVTDPNDSVLYPWRIFISEFANPEAFGSTLNPTFLINGPGYLDLPEKDQIRRIIDFDGTAVIFTDRSVWTCEGTGFDNFTLQKRANVGLVARNAVAYSGRHILFYSTDGIRVLEPNTFSATTFGDSVGPVGTFSCWRVSEPIFSLIQSIPKAYRPNACLGIDEEGCFHFSFTAAGGTLNTLALKLDPKRQGSLDPMANPTRPGWVYYDNWGFSCFVQLRGGDTDQGDLLGGDPTTGTVWRLRQAGDGTALESDNGAVIAWRWTSPVINVGPGNTMQTAWINGEFAPQSSAEVFLTVIMDRGANTEAIDGTLPVAVVGTQVIHGRIPPHRVQEVQAQVSGQHSVAMTCQSLTLGVYNQ